MLNRWFKSKQHNVVQKRLPHQGAASSLSGRDIQFGCSWCQHPVGGAFVLMDVSNCTLPSKTHGFTVTDDLNP